MNTSLLDALRGELAEGSAAVDTVVVNVFGRRSAFLTPSRAQHGDVQMQVLDRFQHGFDALELLRLLARDIAAEYEQEWVADVDPATDTMTLAVRGLFWSGHLLVGEILALLRAGYSVGALARWRAVHEVATRADFLSGLVGELARETARRYVEHEDLRALAELKTTQALLKRKAPDRRFPPAIMSDIDRRRAEAAERYGKEFQGDYGWAHAALLKVSRDYRERVEACEKGRGPVLSDLEAVVLHDLEDRYFWRLLAENANAAVHGAARSVSRPDGGQDLPGVIDGPELQVLAISRVGYACAVRLVSLLGSFVHPYPFEEDEEDEDELARVRILDAACSLAALVERTFIEPMAAAGP